MRFLESNNYSAAELPPHPGIRSTTTAIIIIFGLIVANLISTCSSIPVLRRRPRPMNNHQIGNNLRQHHHQHPPNRQQLVRTHKLVSRNQCTLRLSSDGTTFGLKNTKRTSSSSNFHTIEKSLISSSDQHLTLIPVAPGLVFIQSAKFKLWLCVNGSQIIGRPQRDNQNCLFRQQRAMYSRAAHMHWQHFQLYKSSSYIRIAWSPKMGQICSVRAMVVDDWTRIKNPDFFTLLTADLDQKPPRTPPIKPQLRIPNNQNSRYLLTDHKPTTPKNAPKDDSHRRSIRNHQHN